MFRVTFFSLLLLITSLSFGADITVTGTSVLAGKQTISLAAFRQDNSAVSREFLTVLTSDLTRSGWFIPVEAQSASVTLEGIVQSGASGVAVQVNCKWMAGMRQLSWSITSSHAQVRDAAHALSDFLVTKIAEKPAMASSKIILVGRRGSSSEVYVCDADGARLQQVTSDGKLCMSPTWMPNRNSFLYTSWISGTPAIYKVDLATKRREVLASYTGMNQGAVASPDGSIMALILSRSGGVDLYVQNLANRKLTRITASKSINESSPSWSPNGNKLVYVSDEGRVPRIYTMDVATKQGRRAIYSSEIRESVAPEWGPSDQIAFCGRTGGRYKIYISDATADPRTTSPKLISPSDGADYEDPSWAPDGRHLVCTRTMSFRRSLVVLDTLGDPMQQLFNVSGDWYLPNWARTNNPIR